MSITKKLGFRHRGAVLAVVAVSLMMLLGIGVICVDLGFFYLIRGRLQTTADSAVTAGASQLPGTVAGSLMAIDYAETNMATALHGNVLAPGDVLFGRWNTTTRSPSGISST